MILKCNNPKCLEEFKVEAADMQTMTCKEDSQDEEIRILFFDCPKCGQKIFVQADNEESLQCLARCKVQMAKIAALKAKNKVPKKKQLADFEKERKYLHRCRTSLMERLTGKTVYSYAGESYEMRFAYESNNL